jgi:hypothetical protein
LRSSRPWLQAPDFRQNAAPLVSLLSPSESDRTWMPPNKRQPASPGVSPPSALSASETRLTRVYQARHRPTSGFRALLPVFVLRSLPALFRAGNALGVLLQGVFPSQSLRALSGSVPFVTFATDGKEPRVNPKLSTFGACRLQGFALCEDSSSLGKSLIDPRDRCPPGFSTSKGFPLATARSLRPDPLMCLASALDKP